MKTDIQIARECELKPIGDIATQLGIAPEKIEPYGRYMAKVPVTLIDEEKVKQSRLILVTAISPTKAGIGKTTVSIGLTLGLNKIGKKAAVALREPSLGPCFGIKGGAAGGGYAQVLPMEKINLHFTGDFHAVTSAHNTISALLDNYIYQHRKDGFSLREIYWKRVLDVNDRALRNVVTGLRGDGVVSETGFDITPASELMAILCLATSEEDLQRRIENIVLGITSDGKPFRVSDLGVAGAITVLLRDALSPNLVQTTEHTPAFIHGGPFANIAHGCSSLVATKMAMSYCDYVVTEAGFGADLGAEKFFDIKCRKAGLQPRLVVIVATTQGLKMHGGVDLDHIKEPNANGLKEGLKNLNRHINNMQGFGQPVIVTLNRFDFDTDEEIDIVRKNCEDLGVGFAVNEAFLKGGEGLLIWHRKWWIPSTRYNLCPFISLIPRTIRLRARLRRSASVFTAQQPSCSPRPARSGWRPLGRSSATTKRLPAIPSASPRHSSPSLPTQPSTVRPRALPSVSAMSSSTVAAR